MTQAKDQLSGVHGSGAPRVATVRHSASMQLRRWCRCGKKGERVGTPWVVTAGAAVVVGAWSRTAAEVHRAVGTPWVVTAPEMLLVPSHNPCSFPRVLHALFKPLFFVFLAARCPVSCSSAAACGQPSTSSTVGASALATAVVSGAGSTCLVARAQGPLGWSLARRRQSSSPPRGRGQLSALRRASHVPV